MTNEAELLSDDNLMFDLDDDEGDTALDATAWDGAESFVGVLPRGEPTDDLVRRHATLAETIREIERTCEAFDSVDLSAQAAQLSLRRRTGTLTILRRAVGVVAAFDEAVLESYLSRVYLWSTDVSESLLTLARALNVLAPDWLAFRERLGDVAWVYQNATIEQSRLAEVMPTLPADLQAALRELFACFVHFKLKVDEPFG